MPAQLSKVPADVRPWVKLTAAEVVAAVPGITHTWGYAGPPSDHKNHRCVDYMVPTKAIGDAVVAYVLKHRDRLKINLIIWWGRIWRSYDKIQGGRLYKAGTWAPYVGSSNPHRDHPHVEYAEFVYRAPAAGGSSTGGTSTKPKTVGYVVDGAKLRARGWTLLLGLSGPGTGITKTRRKAGKGLAIARFVTSRDGRRWAVTSYGTHYLAECLTKETK